MLLAEIHGKFFEPARNVEDLLTSEVFGHLRYLSPSIFWERLFCYSLNAPMDGPPESLATVCATQGCRISSYTELRVFFWPVYKGEDEPDLLICFSGAAQRPLVVLVEAKLWAEKSDSPKGDQLVRYLSALGNPSGFNVSLPQQALCAIIYLTPRDSVEEVRESAECSADPLSSARSIFRSQWQDITLAAQETISHECTAQTRMILQDIAAFLRRRNMEYFRGFTLIENFPFLSKRDGQFLNTSSHFLELELPRSFSVEKGKWTQ